MAMDAMGVVEPLGSHFTLAMKGPDTLGVPFHHGIVLDSIKHCSHLWFTLLSKNGLGNKIYKMSPKLQLFWRKEAR